MWLPEEWIFESPWDDEPDTLAPYNDLGILYTREQWEIVKAQVDRFFSLVADGAVEEWNEAKTLENERRMLRETSGLVRAKTRTDHPGYIYVMLSGEGHCKIGKSRNPQDRQRNLGIKLPFSIELLYTAQVRDMGLAELFLHKALSPFHLNGEWFSLPTDRLEWITDGEWLAEFGETVQ